MLRASYDVGISESLAEPIGRLGADLDLSWAARREMGQPSDLRGLLWHFESQGSGAISLSWPPHAVGILLIPKNLSTDLS